MKIKQKDLLDDLIELTKQVLNSAEKYKQLTLEELNYKDNSESWSILECIEHLNLYGDFYLPEIENKIVESRTKPTTDFKSGLLGNYFAKSMLPKQKLNKMKTFKDKNPIGSDLNASTLERFIIQQKQMLDLLNKAREVNLNKVKTGITIASWIKLKLGDTFRVVIYHNQRHIAQANRILK
jgi:hypothetical protein